MALSFFAAAKRHAIIWSVLILAPLSMLCLQWVTAGYPVGVDADPFGLQELTTLLFIFASFVAAVSGIVFLIAASRDGGLPHRSKELTHS